ncbi:hypothetical protein L5515_018690 [Caenorhabditis briggsae]|uniref:Uncharacterized protein n=1 Tax=Caenorhabditis briggsae TaxID=6238 RepID=A0AAE9JS84_CAEBR|nr:hypothetical protein L5515_018690 [Caenorhabditis briggsae]
MTDRNHLVYDQQTNDSSPNAVSTEEATATSPPNMDCSNTANNVSLPTQDTRIQSAADTPPITVDVRQAELINKALIDELQMLQVQVHQANRAKALETQHRLQMEADLKHKIHQLMSGQENLKRAPAFLPTTASHDATVEMPSSTHNVVHNINVSHNSTHDISNHSSATEDMLANIMTAVSHLTAQQERSKQQNMLRTARLEQLVKKLASADHDAHSSEPMNSKVDEFETQNANEEQYYTRTAYSDSKSRSRAHRRSRSRSYSPKADRHSSHDLKLNLDFSVKFIEQFTGSENFDAFIQSFDRG